MCPKVEIGKPLICSFVVGLRTKNNDFQQKNSGYNNYVNNAKIGIHIVC